ncbi:uncharacterized protein LOC142980609 [Anticarsia gemmatalis]|uniref:uncharacterized protein LOC142980609 n=1 Tax=Anticarsia gemmatalis TaxID=129554 RepID=UPI003F766F1E
MSLLPISLLLFCNLLLSNSEKPWPDDVKIRRVSDLNQCPCFPGGQGIYPPIFSPEGLERLVVYIYRDPYSRKVTLYTPDAAKQALIPNIPIGVYDKLKYGGRDSIASIIHDNPQIFKINAVGGVKDVPADVIGYSAGVVKKVSPTPEPQIHSSYVRHPTNVCKNKKQPGCFHQNGYKHTYEQQNYVTKTTTHHFYPQKIISVERPTHSGNHQELPIPGSQQLEPTRFEGQKPQNQANTYQIHSPWDPLGPNQQNRPLAQSQQADQWGPRPQIPQWDSSQEINPWEQQAHPPAPRQQTYSLDPNQESPRYQNHQWGPKPQLEPWVSNQQASLLSPNQHHRPLGPSQQPHLWGPTPHIPLWYPSHQPHQSDPTPQAPLWDPSHQPHQSDHTSQTPLWSPTPSATPLGPDQQDHPLGPSQQPLQWGPTPQTPLWGSSQQINPWGVTLQTRPIVASHQIRPFAPSQPFGAKIQTYPWGPKPRIPLWGSKRIHWGPKHIPHWGSHQRIPFWGLNQQIPLGPRPQAQLWASKQQIQPKAPENNYSTFDQWFNSQMVTFKDIKTLNKNTKETTTIDTALLRVLVQNTLLENNMQVGSKGVITDSNGAVIDLHNLQLRPILIGSPVTYQQALQGVKKLTLPKDSPYLEGILVSLVYPPKVLGVIPLGKTYVSLPRRQGGNSDLSSVYVPNSIPISNADNPFVSVSKPQYTNDKMSYTNTESKYQDRYQYITGYSTPNYPWGINEARRKTNDNRKHHRDRDKHYKEDHYPEESQDVNEPQGSRKRPHDSKVKFNFNNNYNQNSKVIITPIDSQWDSSTNTYLANRPGQIPSKPRPNFIYTPSNQQSKVIITPIDSKWDSSTNNYWGDVSDHNRTHSSSADSPQRNKQSKVIITPIDSKWDTSSNTYYLPYTGTKERPIPRPNFFPSPANVEQPRLVARPYYSKKDYSLNDYIVSSPKPETFEPTYLDSQRDSSSNTYLGPNTGTKADTKKSNYNSFPIYNTWDTSSNAYSGPEQVSNYVPNFKPNIINNPYVNQQSKIIATPIDSQWDASSNSYSRPSSGSAYIPNFTPNGVTEKSKLIAVPIYSDRDIPSNVYEGPQIPSNAPGPKPNGPIRPPKTNPSKVIITPIDSYWDSSTNTYVGPKQVPSNFPGPKPNGPIRPPKTKPSKDIITPIDSYWDSSTNTYVGPKQVPSNVPSPKPNGPIRPPKNKQSKVIITPIDSYWDSSSNSYSRPSSGSAYIPNFTPDGATEKSKLFAVPIYSDRDIPSNVYEGPQIPSNAPNPKPNGPIRPPKNKPSKMIITPIDSYWDSSTNSFVGPKQVPSNFPGPKPNGPIKPPKNKPSKVIITPIDSYWDSSTNSFVGPKQVPSNFPGPKPNGPIKPPKNNPSKVIITPIDSHWDSSSNIYSVPGFNKAPYKVNVSPNPTEKYSNIVVNRVSTTSKSETVYNPNNQRRSDIIITPVHSKLDSSSNIYWGPNEGPNSPASKTDKPSEKRSNLIVTKVNTNFDSNPDAGHTDSKPNSDVNPVEKRTKVTFTKIDSLMDTSPNTYWGPNNPLGPYRAVKHEPIPAESQSTPAITPIDSSYMSSPVENLPLSSFYSVLPADWQYATGYLNPDLSPKRRLMQPEDAPSTTSKSKSSNENSTPKTVQEQKNAPSVPNKSDAVPKRRVSIPSVLKALVNMVVQRIQKDGNDGVGTSQSRRNGNFVPRVPLSYHSESNVDDDERPDFRIIGGTAGTSSGSPVNNKGRSGLGII